MYSSCFVLVLNVTITQALHIKGKANTDHTTLLLNCYTKLKDVTKLNEFVRRFLVFFAFFLSLLD